MNFSLPSFRDRGSSNAQGPGSPGGGGAGNKSFHDDSSSQVSDMSYTTAGEGSWMRRISSTFGASDSSVDDAMSNIYGDPDALEERCRNSLNSITNFEHSDESARRKSLAMTAAMASLGVKHSRTADETIAALPEGLFTQDFDPVAMQLDRIKDFTDDELTETFMTTIEDTDISKDAVVSKLFVMIESNYDDLMSCMRDVHAIDIDLARTNVQITNSIRKLRSADTLIVSGTLHITKLHTMKQRLLKVEAIVAEVLKLKEMYKATQTQTNEGQLGMAATTAHDLLNALQDEIYEQIHSVSHLGDSVQNLIPIIRFKTDKALFRLCCGQFSAAQYGDILSSYLMLDQMQETMGVQIIDASLVNQAGSPDSCHTDTRACTDGLAERVLRFLCLYINMCIRTAVAEFLPAGAKEELLSLDVLSVSTEDILEYVTPEVSVQCVVRACELLGDIAHTHYLVTQWHRTPFDSRNLDAAFLHRCPNELINEELDGSFDDDEEEDSEYSDEEEGGGEGDGERASVGGRPRTRSRSASQGAGLFQEHPEGGSVRRKRGSSRAPAVSLRGVYDASADAPEDIGERLRAARLVFASQQLSRSRAHLWGSVEGALVHLLGAVRTTSATTVEDFLSMNWSIQSLIKIGMEFSGSASRHITHTMKEKCVEYFGEIHRDSFEQLRQMIECETWSSVPVKLGEMGGIIGIIKSNVRRREAGSAARSKIRLPGMIRETEEMKKRKTAALAAKYAPSAADAPSSPPKASRHMDGSALPTDAAADSAAGGSILMSFHKFGSPLHYTPFVEGEFGEDGVSAGGAGGSAGYFSPLGSDFLSLLLEEDAGSTARTRKGQDKSAAVVVTQSALNGLAKFTGKYLLMMHLMSAAAVDIFMGLRQLFEYYLCAVFNGFVPLEDRKNVLHPLPRTSPHAPPPMQAQDFEGLHTCLSRALIEIVAVAPEAELPAETHAAGGGGGGGLSSMASLYSGAAANIYSSLSASLSMDALSAAGAQGGGGGGATSALGANYTPTPGIIRVADVLKVPIPMKNANYENFYALNERIVAAESCWFVAKVCHDGCANVVIRMIYDCSRMDKCLYSH
jgi:hypothetical protein